MGQAISQLEYRMQGCWRQKPKVWVRRGPGSKLGTETAKGRRGGAGLVISQLEGHECLKLGC